MSGELDKASGLESQEVLILVNEAFRNVPSPARFADHPGCDECEQLDAAFSDNPQTLPDGIGIAYRLMHFTPEAFRYLMPLFVRTAIDEPDDDFAENLVDELAQPISKTAPPDCLPHTKGFDRAQTSATLAFLRFVRDRWFTELDEPPRCFDRAIRNWKHFLSCFDRPQTPP